jgi:hypothetical protein
MLTDCSIELPSLYNISEAYYVNTTMDMNITTYPLQAAGNLTLLGHLQTYVSPPLSIPIY